MISYITTLFVDSTRYQFTAVHYGFYSSLIILLLLQPTTTQHHIGLCATTHGLLLMTLTHKNTLKDSHCTKLPLQLFHTCLTFLSAGIQNRGVGSSQNHNKLNINLSLPSPRQPLKTLKVSLVLYIVYFTACHSYKSQQTKSWNN